MKDKENFEYSCFEKILLAYLKDMDSILGWL